MRNENEMTDVSLEYAAAYAAHYTGHDLRLALQLYRKLLASHPNAQEAGYSRMQVGNIVKAVVPKQALLDAQMELAIAQLEHDVTLDTERIPVARLA